LENVGIGTTRRELILHDSFTFLVLGLATLALFAVTLFLFRSFEGHRADLAQSFAERGQAEMQAGKPGAAVNSLRASLSYAPDDYATQLLLAQALAEAGETDQATNYYLNLWSARPGDGFLNLQLARLERQKGNREDAIAYYRASIFGDWRGDGAVKRRTARLELVDYLVQLKDYPAAKVELLIAAGNAPDNFQLNLLFADKLRGIGDATDALTYYEKAIADDPHSEVALEDAGRTLYEQGSYARAAALFLRAVSESHQPAPEELRALLRDSQRIQELSIARELPAKDRARHLLEAAKIAQTRFTACFLSGHEGMVSSIYGDAHLRTLQALTQSWADAKDESTRQKMVQTAAGQDELAQLIMQTELLADDDPMAHPQFSCGPPKGDDALLLRLARGWKPDEGTN
jgi:Tfp pilus assembly protein PilF